MTAPEDSLCGGERHVWHLPQERQTPPEGSKTGALPDDRCYCCKLKFRDLPEGSEYANVYIDGAGTVQTGPFWTTK